jgi:hypothetical protein
MRKFIDKCREEVRLMANIIRNSVVKFNLDTLTDEELDTIIKNTQAQQAQMTQFYNGLVNERVRRGLKLRTPRTTNQGE